MAIDFIIDYVCVPKQQLSTEGMLERIKGKARAEAVIKLFRDNGDQRDVSEIGFEFARNTPDGPEETRVIMIQDLLDHAAELTQFESYCTGCPANRTGEAFGCFGQIQYPISGVAEIWLLNRLPNPTEPLPWLLLRQGVEELQSDGTAVNAMRAPGQPFFQEAGVLARGLGEFVVNTNQLFEMLFMVGHIQPSYAGTLLLFFGAIRRDMEADEILAISRSPEDALEKYPFLLEPEFDDDNSITQIKDFLRALYLAWGLKTRLLLDV